MSSVVDRNLARRREIGNQRRERTRLRLLTAAAQVLAAHGEQKATIDDFVQAAGVARGTFYNYYKTVGELTDDLWMHIGHDPFLDIQQACESIISPAERLAAMTRLVLQVTERDTAWGWVVFAMSADKEIVNDELLSFPRPILEQGQDCGEFRIDDLIAATDLTVSTIRGAMQRMLNEQREAQYPVAICRLLLRALGVTKTETERIVKQALPSLIEKIMPIKHAQSS